MFQDIKFSDPYILNRHINLIITNKTNQSNVSTATKFRILFRILSYSTKERTIMFMSDVYRKQYQLLQQFQSS